MSFDHDLQLAAAEATGLQEFLRLLEIVVEGRGTTQIDADLGRDDLAGRQRRPVMHGDDADHVAIGRQHDRRKTPAIGNRLPHAVENALLLLAQRVAIDRSSVMMANWVVLIA